jgi:6-phosphogluconolactonase (cycloisomerase 2 family)
MVVGNQRSNNLSVFTIHPTEGTLKKVSETHVAAPNFVFTSAATPLI